MSHFLRRLSISTQILRSSWGIGASLIASLLLASCSSQTETSISSPLTSPTSSYEENLSSTDDKKVVLTTFTILADMARNVAGDKLVINSITRIGAEIHGYEPTPSDLKKAQNADLILYNGMNLERWFEKFLGNVRDVPSVVLTEGIEPIPIVEGPYTDKPNPHAWMSPKNALIYIENIRKAFVSIDPKNADTYNANAQAYSDEIRKIDQQLEVSLQKVPSNQRYLVSCEGAFSYLTRDYGMKEIYMWPINAEQQYTPRQIQSIISKVKANDVPSIFCESTVNNEAQKQVAQITGVNFGGDLYVDSLSTTNGPVPTYIDLLKYDVNKVVRGLTSRAN
ncbi:metal ABC transporter substrate-binding protein [Synechococcus elongatus]|uniref:metal ABC transporter substrate-binding protein n=1 Tax=Synechococcus elongatus TaxID=32046 RepID=UPI001EE106B5|nr:metal ABC transporter substrate-binding protein [Synechococcus elongatus]